MFDPNISILVVDDMMTMRKIVIKALTELGFKNFKEASDGAAAWEMLNAETPSFGLVVSDWNMPNCTGIDLLKRVRGDSRFKLLPFFLITAESEKNQIMEALKLGVSGYVVKPFTAEAIKKQFEEACQRGNK